MEEHSLSRMLLDLREAQEEGTDNASHVHGASSELGDLYRSGMSLAVVGSGNDPVLQVLFESVALNRGVRAKVFTDRDQAMAWLL